MPMSIDSSTTNNNSHIYSVPFGDDRYVWGRDIDGLHPGEYLADMITYGDRYNSEALRLPVSFVLGLSVGSFKIANNQVLEVVVITDLPTGGYVDHERLKSLLKVLRRQH